MTDATSRTVGTNVKESELLLFPGEGYRFLTGYELPMATDEHLRHDGKHSVGRAPCGKDFTFLTAAKLRKLGVFVRRRK